MLLRSASTPVLNSLVHTSSPRESPIESESIRHRSVMVSASSSSCCYSPMSMHSNDESTRRMKRTASESDLRHLLTKPPPASKFPAGGSLAEDVEEGIGFGIIGTSSYDGGEFGFNWDLEEEIEINGGCGGGMFHGGGKGRTGGGRSDGGGEKREDSNSNSKDGTEIHYRKMIEANPGNGLLLSNYAKFLKEVRKDYVKAEEYCGRAILASPNDGNVLAMYAELIWTVHKDSSRAETYFNQAVAASPNDCYVQASYARFLWDAEDEEEEEERHEEFEPRMSFFTGPSPIPAMS